MTTRRLIDIDITDRADGKVPVWRDASNTHEYEDAPAASSGMVLLDEVVLGSAAATITFSGILGTFEDLKLVGRFRTDKSAATGQIRLRVGNGSADTGSNYRYHAEAFFGNGTTNRHTSNSAAEILAGRFWMPAASATAGRFGIWEATIFDYADTAFERLIQGQGGSIPTGTTSDWNQGIFNGAWMNTAAAINVVELAEASGANWVAGTKVRLYGLR